MYVSLKKTSSEIDRALRQTSQLRKLILSLRKAREEAREMKREIGEARSADDKESSDG